MALIQGMKNVNKTRFRFRRQVNGGVLEGVRRSHQRREGCRSASRTARGKPTSPRHWLLEHKEPGGWRRGYRREQRWVFSKSLHRRTGSADMAIYDVYNF